MCISKCSFIVPKEELVATSSECARAHACVGRGWQLSSVLYRGARKEVSLMFGSGWDDIVMEVTYVHTGYKNYSWNHFHLRAMKWWVFYPLYGSETWGAVVSKKKGGKKHAHVIKPIIEMKGFICNENICTKHTVSNRWAVRMFGKIKLLP